MSEETTNEEVVETKKEVVEDHLTHNQLHLCRQC